MGCESRKRCTWSGKVRAETSKHRLTERGGKARPTGGHLVRNDSTLDTLT